MTLAEGSDTLHPVAGRGALHEAFPGDDMTEVQTNAETTRGSSRRSVIKTAAHAAWVVPAVTIATAAPALAASTTKPAAMTAQAGQAAITAAGAFMNGTVTNTGGVTINNPITVVITVSGVNVSTLAGFSIGGTGWSGTVSYSGGVLGVGGTNTITLTYTGGALAAGATTPAWTLNALVSVSLGTATGTASATAADGTKLTAPVAVSSGLISALN